MSPRSYRTTSKNRQASDTGGGNCGSGGQIGGEPRPRASRGRLPKLGLSLSSGRDVRSAPTDRKVHRVTTFLQTTNHAPITPSRQCCLEAEACAACCVALNFFEHSAPGRKAAASGENGDLPCAIKSESMKFFVVRIVRQEFCREGCLTGAVRPATM